MAAAAVEDEEFGAALERYRGALISVALDRTGRLDVAEEIAQEAIVRAWEHRLTLRETAAIGRWLFRIGINCCIAWQRKDSRTATVEALAAGVRWEPPVMEELIRRDTIREVRRALAGLPMQSRIIVLMHAMGYRRAEIAEFLSVPESTVRGRLARARDRLRRGLDDRLHLTLGGKERGDDE